MKVQTRLFLNRSINSMLLSIEIFNRPHEKGRCEAVLILMDHAFEMLLKGIVYERTGRVRSPGEIHNYGQKKCINILKDNLKVLSENQAINLNTINGLRDNAMHHIIDLSEDSLYLHSQNGVTLFNDLMLKEFNQSLGDHIPERVLPISTKPPSDINVFFDSEFKEIQKMLRPGKRQTAKAIARIRPLVVLEKSLEGDEGDISDLELQRIIKDFKDGKKWRDLFPEVSGIKMNSEGTGLTFNVRLTKGEGAPVRFLKNGEDAKGTPVIREVDLLDRYSMNITAIANKLKISRNKMCAVVEHLGIQKNEDFFKEFKIGTQRHKRYDPKVLPLLEEEMKKIDLEKVWKTYYDKHYRK